MLLANPFTQTVVVRQSLKVQNMVFAVSGFVWIDLSIGFFHPDYCGGQCGCRSGISSWESSVVRFRLGFVSTPSGIDDFCDPS